MILSPTSDDRLLGALGTQGVPGRLAAITAIREEGSRIAAWPASLAGHWGEVGDRWEDLYVVAGVRRRGLHDEWQVVPIRDESVLRDPFPTIKRVWTISVVAAEIEGRNAVGNCHLDFKEAGLPEQCEKMHVGTVSPPSFAPSSKSSVDGAARTAACEWHVLPTAPGRRHLPRAFIAARSETGGMSPSAPRAPLQ